jgi:hypothetical protein
VRRIVARTKRRGPGHEDCADHHQVGKKPH